MSSITRVGFCPSCYEKGWPKTNQAFLIANGSDELKSKRAIRNGKRGFVPTMYLLSPEVNGKYYFHTLCSMEGCGTYISEEDGRKFLCLDETRWTPRKEITLNNWNSLVRFTDTGFEI